MAMAVVVAMILRSPAPLSGQCLALNEALRVLVLDSSI